MRSFGCDLLVVGSGAGGLSAAVTAAWHGLRVVVAEKATTCGGATAWSGGWMWVPGNTEQPRLFLKNVLGERYDEARVEAFLDAGPQMVAFFEQHTALQFVTGTWIADIYGHLPGAGTGGRSVVPAPYQAGQLGRRLFARLRPQLYETSLAGMGIMAGPDLQAFLHATRSPRAFLHAGRRVAGHALDLATYGRGRHLVNGQALIARLMRSADDLGVRIWTSAPAVRLIVEGGAVRGAVVAHRSGDVQVRADQGVVLAAGGFPRDVERRRRLFPRTPTGREHWTLAPATTTGDGITLGESAGGVLDTSLASPAAWCPVSLVPYRNGRTGVYPHIIDRGKPGLIAVLADGRRFVNEADGYHDVVAAMLREVPDGQEVAAWLICDHAFQRRYPFGMAKPFPVPAWPYVRSGYLRTARTLTDLAVACGIDPAGLEQTVIAFNVDARSGVDTEFGRGSTPFNRGSGDPDHGPNPSLGPIERPPYYAIKIRPGSFGTFAGLRADVHARVLDTAGAPIPGLYVAGCDQANVLAGHYPAGGINIGPAMTFGYLAGRHAAGVTGTGA